MTDKLAILEKCSKELEPDKIMRNRLRNAIVNHTENFLDELSESRAYIIEPDKSEKIINEPFDDEANSSIDQIVNNLAEQLDIDGINPASGFHMGYVPGGGLYASSLADYWADVTNRYAGVFFANPGAVRLENKLIRWMAEMMNYPSEAFGNLTSGGSIANLTAIITAREAHSIKAKEISQTVIYTSDQLHHCVPKALKMAGLGELVVRNIGLDQHYRMQTDLLQTQIINDRKNGLMPWMVVASAGTTDTGAIDPLEEIGTIANKEKIWFHVDAAYGGFFMMTDEGKARLKGIALSDSVVMDPHKSLFLPYGSGVVLVKDGNLMKQAFSETASYLQDFDPENEDISPSDVSIELTKPFRGLRMWLPLKLHGLAPFRAALQEKLLLAQYFYREIKTLGFKVGPYPDLTVVHFWFEPGSGDQNSFNKKLIARIQQHGQIFLSSTMLNGLFVIRMCILVFRTHKREVDIALKIIDKQKKVLLLSK